MNKARQIVNRISYNYRLTNESIPEDQRFLYEKNHIIWEKVRKLQKEIEILEHRKQFIQGQKYFTYEKIQIEIDLYNLFINTLEDEYKKNIIALTEMVEGATNG